MKIKWIIALLCLLCVGLPAVALAQSDTPSVLDRVQNVDNPELSELIRLAIENQSKLRKIDQLGQIETMQLIRKVTVSYTQIKLFDQQIAEISRKIEAQTGPAEMRYELTLAKTDLEAKLATEVANLREWMGIIPRHAFEKQPIKSLSSWIILRVLDEGVYVLDSLQPLDEWWAKQRLKSLGLQSRNEALDYIREKLKDPNNFPIRIDHRYTAEMSFAAKVLHGKVVSMITEANCQMDAEVNLTQITNVSLGVSMLFIRGGTISALYANGVPIQRPDGDPKPIVTGVVEPNDLEQHIMWRLLRPKNVPMKFRIEHDQTSTKLARQTADKVRVVAKNLGISELVEVERIPIEAVPESDFLGRWQAITKGEVQTIDIQPTGVCVFVKSPGSEIRGGPSVSGRWFLTPKEIFMDIKDRRDFYYVYRGHIDKEGHLVVERGEYHNDGSFRLVSFRPTLFKKVY